MMEVSWKREMIDVAGIKLHLARGGTGPKIVLLHRDVGTPDRLAFYDKLAQDFEVLIPHHPGFSKSERPEWMRSVRDVAAIYRILFGQLELRAPPLLGLGVGGWIAAELSTFAPYDSGDLVLVGAMGVKPPQGEIEDQALISYIDYVRKGFSSPDSFAKIFGERPTSDQLVDWDLCREMSFRIAWRPYMYSDTLPYLLPGIRSRALVIHGTADSIVPPSCSQFYSERIRGARQEQMSGAGHFIEMEQPDELAKSITAFIRAN
jgi:pimeloyl-ACP methyl ester carboxylesterase